MAKLKSSRVYGNLTVDDILLVSTDATVTGNLTVLGTTTTVNSTTVTIEGPIVQQGAGANGAALVSNDGKDRGLDLSYYAGGAQLEAFMGWNTANSEFAFGDNVTITGDVVAFNTYGNVRALHYIGEGDKLGNVTGANVTGWVAQANYANYAGTVVNASQGNITSLGNLTNLQIGNATTTGNVVIDTNGNITATGSIIANGAQSNLIIGTSVANNSQANIYGNLYVSGTISGTINATISAKGSSWDVQYKDDTGNLAGSDAFKFDAGNSNTLTVGTGNIKFVGDTGIANIKGNINLTGTNQTISGANVTLKGTNELDLLGDTSNIKLTASGINLATSGGTASLDDNGNLTVSGTANFAGGNLVADQNGNVNAAGYGSFANLYDTGLTANYIVFPDSTGKLKGTAGFTISSNVLSANNIAATDANLTGNVTLTGHTAGNLLTTNSDGNIIDSSVSFSTGTLTVTNANITANLKTSNLQVTSFNNNGIPIADVNGNLSTVTGLTYSSNTLNANNFTTVGTANVANLIVTSLAQSEIPYANSTSGIAGDVKFTYTPSTSTLNAPNITANTNITATGNVEGGNVIADNLTGTEVVFAGTGGILKGDSSFTFASDTLTANTINAAMALHSANIYDTDLAMHSVVIAGTGGQLLDDTAGGFAYYTGNSTLTSNNITISNLANVQGNLTVSGNANVQTTLIAGNVQTDHLLYANGTAWDFAKANGLSTYIQYKGVTGDLAGSANFTYDDTTQLFKVTGNANITVEALIGGNANVTGNVLAQNIKANANIVASNANITTTAIIATLVTDTINTGNTHTDDITIHAGNINLNASSNISANSQYITNVKDPHSAQDAATKNYVDSVAQGLHVHDPVAIATTDTLANISGGTVTYNDNGASGVGDYITLSVALDLIDGAHFSYLKSSVSPNPVRILVKNEVDEKTNGVYTVSSDGLTLTRASDFDTPVKVHGGDFLFVQYGTMYKAAGFVQTQDTDVIGDGPSASNIEFSQFSGAGSFSADTAHGMELDGSVFRTKINTDTMDYDMMGNLKVADSAIFVTPNIGAATGSSLDLSSGNITAGNVTGANLISASYLTGTLTSDSNAQPNITSVGTLTSLSTSGNISIGNASPTNGILTDNIYKSDGTPWDFAKANGSSTWIQYSNGTDLAASANLTFDDSTQNLTVNGNIITGAGSGGNISGANNISANTFTGTLTTSAQPNITSVGTLTSLAVHNSGTGNIEADNITSNTVTVSNLTSNSVVFSGTGGNLTEDNANFYYDPMTYTLHVKNANVTNTLNANIEITGVSPTQIVFGNTGNTLISNADLTFASGTLSLTGEAVISGNANVGNLYSNGISDTQLVFGAGNRLTSNADLTFTAGTLSLTGDTVISGNANVGNIYSNGVSSTGIVYASGKKLVTDTTNFNYTAGTLTVPNANVTTTLTVGNIVDSGLKTNQIAYTTTGNAVSGSDSFTYDGTSFKVGTSVSVNGTTGAVVAANITSNNLTSTQVVYSGTGGKLTSDSGFTYVTNTTTLTANNFVATSTANLGAVGNVTITGGSDGQYLVANGTGGGLKWASVDAAKINNGTSNVDIPVADGNINMSVGGNANVVVVTGTGANVTGILDVSGNITGNNITSNHYITANGTTDATDAVTGTIKTAGGISAQGNIYTGDAVGFAHGGGNTDSAAYIKFNASANSIDFIFN